MRLDKMFAAQKALREHINYNEPDRFEKLVLALLVEIGECANCWRGFKFWSKDQEPRTSWYKTYFTEDMHGGPQTKWTNPLLEEYVDGLHFVLELGIEIEIDENDWMIDKITKVDVVEQFICLNQSVIDLWDQPSDIQLIITLEHYLGLGELLGFTEEQIEQAYYDKNKVNHERQENGY